MLSNFEEPAREVLTLAKKEMHDLNHPYVSSEHLLLAILKTSEEIASRFKEYKVDYKILKEEIIKTIGKGSKPNEWFLYTPLLKRVIENAIIDSKENNNGSVTVNHLFSSLLEEGEGVAIRILIALDVDIDELYNEFAYKLIHKKEYKKLSIEEYGVNLNEKALNGELDPVTGRDTEIKRVIEILSRKTKNNPLLIGKAGVGKTAIAEELSNMISKGNVPLSLKNKRIINIDMATMVAGTKYRGEFEERVNKILEEVESNPDIILFIDEIHTLVGAGGAEGAIDASNIFKPALARGKLRCIGATTIEEYKKYIEKDAALERRFQTVIVEEPSIEETIEILKGIRGLYERHHQVEISDEGVEAAVTLSARYVSDRFLPDKAIDLMDEAAAKVRLGLLGSPLQFNGLHKQIHEAELAIETALQNGDIEQVRVEKANKEALVKELEKLEKKSKRSSNRKITVIGETEIADIVAGWTKIPVNKLTENEAARLQKLEKVLKKRVIGQEEAVTAVSKAVRRGRVGLKDPKRPIGSFLFLGPTGVGKTEVSKALAEAVFGKEESMIRVDMSEYMEKHSVSKMIGSPPGYVGHDEGGQLSEKVRRNPFSVILFDEIEKAHPDVFNVLLQVLDEGHITDSQGRKVDFKNTIIIMTSNAGAQAIIEPKRLGFGNKEDEKQDHKKMKDSVMEEVKRIFKPEFLNRIDETIVFRALNKEDMKQIVSIMVGELQKRCKEQLNIELSVTANAKTYIVDKAYDRKYGARPLKRKLQDEVEDVLAEEIIAGKIKAGDKVTVSVKKDAICISK